MLRTASQTKGPLTRRELVLTLALMRGVGAKTIVRILTRNDLIGRTPDEFLKLPTDVLREEYRITKSVAAAWAANWQKAFGDATELQKKIDKTKVDIVTAADIHFPSRIEQMDSDAPGVLFVYGNTKLLQAKTFSVLASRNTSDACLDQIEQLAEAGVLAGEVLVSGHDTRAYQRASIVPLRWGSPRILVLDVGMFTSLGEELTEEPFRAARLWRYKFDPQSDLIVSPCVPQVAYQKALNQVRDRLIGGLSDRLDFASVSKGGNMEQLARAALRAGRPVRVSAACELAEMLSEMGASLIEERRT